MSRLSRKRFGIAVRNCEKANGRFAGSRMADRSLQAIGQVMIYGLKNLSAAAADDSERINGIEIRRDLHMAISVITC